MEIRITQEAAKLAEGEVWLRAWCAYTQASNSTDRERATVWADACLRDFRQRFNPSEAPVQS